MLNKIFKDFIRYGKIESDIEVFEAGVYYRHLIIYDKGVYYRFKLINGNVKEIEVMWMKINCNDCKYNINGWCNKQDKILKQKSVCFDFKANDERSDKKWKNQQSNI